MNIKRIGIFLLIALFLFGCKPDPEPDPEKEKQGGAVTVSFDTDGGTPSAIAAVSVDKGSSLGSKLPANPKKSGLAFGGWYKTEDLFYSTKYISSTPINDNITLKARWLPQQTSDVNFSNFASPTATTIGSPITYQGKENVIKLSPNPSGGEYAWNVVSYSLAPYIGREITITLSMDIWIGTAVNIAWQLNNKPTWSLLAGDNNNPQDANEWVHLAGSGVTLTPASGDNNGNLVYLSGGGDGGQLANKAIDIYIANFTMTIADSGTPVVPPEPGTVLLTIGRKINLTSQLGSAFSGLTATWASADASKVAVDTSGNVTSNITSFSTADGTQRYTQGAARAEVMVTATAGVNTQTFKVVATTEAQENITTAEPFKNYFPASILVGNIATTGDGGGSFITNANLTRHFNALTSENDMKPSSISNGRDSTTGVINYTWTNADRVVKSAYGSNMKIIGHTLLWHSQIPAWQTSMKDETSVVALAAMKKFITEVVTHFKGKIYSWDVLNEVFPDGASGTWTTAMRQENPWVKSIGSDFVYEGFLAARLADPDAILYYNDFNTDNSAKATLIRDMVKAVNDKYLSSGDKPGGESSTRLLIEGIGMQEHHNSGITAASVRATLNLFKGLNQSGRDNIRIAVSEIDVLAQDWSSFSSVGQGANKQAASTVTNNGLLIQARQYGEFMGVYMEFKDIIERISIWGVNDNNSWRSAGLPLLFDSNGRAKPAYYKFAGAVVK
jgi:endo-1,4-beta-xylanase